MSIVEHALEKSRASQRARPATRRPGDDGTERAAGRTKQAATFDIYSRHVKSFDDVNECDASYWADAFAASSISFVTSAGWDVITTCDAPAISTVFLECARFAMKDSAASGMFLSALP